ncbi:hypothetical protein [Deinococcus altitudinis]|uniref:hypothetical protein n=1 Tax=Deinococcus altitudinis TaxID=468914 RepID=UPI003891940E
MNDASVTRAEYQTWTSEEVCQRLLVNRRSLHRLLAHIEEVFGFRALRIGTVNQHAVLFKTPEMELLERASRFASRYGRFKGRYAAAALVVFAEMEQNGSLDLFENIERKLQRLRSQVAAFEKVAATAATSAAVDH